HYFGYRNKIEFSFTEHEGKMSLAFFGRGSRNKHAVQGSVLAEPIINETAQKILDWVNEVAIPLRSLKALILRSNGKGECIAALFIKDKLEFTNFPKTSETFLGFHLYYSTHKSPASVPTELLYSAGQDYLIADILGTQLKFGLLSFFQINIPIFTEAVKDIAAFIGPKDSVLDFYSGVGAISLPLAKNRPRTILVESNAEAVEYAKQNIELNGLKNAEAHCMPAEKITELIDSTATVIVDPPRAGLHDKVTLALLNKKPPRIVYLSCDLATQARDIQRLSESYKPIFIKLYNFFPRTPHIEGLIILERMGT
ncbi:MAG: class I SAM-dependent RNA methyltransferase, partial [Candidatus Magasanikbacteria bacterium]|nr:class I SAM-dependent RNA methyltransferase [Candidatus Magasanikbacteria bacterium]